MGCIIQMKRDDRERVVVVTCCSCLSVVAGLKEKEIKKINCVVVK